MPLFILAIPAIVTIRLIKPWLLVRWGELPSPRIGHFAEAQVLEAIGGDYVDESEVLTPADDQNHIDINIDKLTQLKIPIIESEAEELNDVGLDGFASDYENGCLKFEGVQFGGGYEYPKTYNNIMEEIEISGFPINKWFNVVIRVQNLTMDTYINGTIVNRHEFKSPPKQNYGNIYVFTFNP